MKPTSVKEIREQLQFLEPYELQEVILRLARFKKENKELLTYLLFKAKDEDAFIDEVEREIEADFQGINRNSYFYMKKSMRRILRNVKKYSRYSGKKETESVLLLCYLKIMNEISPSVHRDRVLKKLYQRQREKLELHISTLHEDLQFDLKRELDLLPH